MVFSDFHFYSDVLEIETAAYVLMPDEKVIRQSSEPVPVLYLLHGLSGDHTTWMRQTSIERYARRYRVCVVMPAANKSYYMDDTFIGEELPAIIERCIPFVSKKREGRFAAGLSMGGYGAMKLGLSRPGRYAAVASLSGALGIDHIYDERGKRPASYFQMMDLIFDGEENLRRSKGYLTRYARKLAKMDFELQAAQHESGQKENTYGVWGPSWRFMQWYDSKRKDHTISSFCSMG